jgi:hypothetical protein
VNARLKSWTERLALAAGWPVVVRDLRAGQRNPRITWTTIGAVALLSAAVIIGVLGVTAAGAAEPEELGRVMVQIVYWSGVVLVCLVFPGMAAVPLVSERERKSLDLVLMSQLSPSSLALGAVGASTANGFVMLAALVPPLVLALIFGGVPWWMIIAMGATIGGFGLLTATLGVQASATAPSTVRAVLQSYLTAWILPGVAMCIFGAVYAELLWEVETGRLWPQAWQLALHIGGLTGVCIGLLVLLAILVARNALLPPGGNRSTSLRLYYLLLLFTGAFVAIGYAGYVLSSSPFGAVGSVRPTDWRAFGSTVLGVMWTVSLVAVLAMATEDPGGRRVERRARRWSGGWVLVQTFYPGAARGAIFTLVVSGLALCTAGAVLDAMEIAFCTADVRWGHRIGGVQTLLALGGWSVLVALGLIGVLGRRLLGTAARARVVAMLLGVGTQLFAAIGVIWHMGQYREVNLSLFNGSLFSIITLSTGAWMPSGTNEFNLDLILGQLVVPFPLVFAAMHFGLAAALGVVLWFVKPPPLPFDLEEPSSPGEGQVGVSGESVGGEEEGEGQEQAEGEGLREDEDQ